MKILIVNLHSSLNAGDDVLTRVSIDLLQQNFPTAQIMLAMNDPDSWPNPEVVVGSFVSWLKPNGAFGKGSLIGFVALSFTVFAALFYRAFRIKVFSILPNRFYPLVKAYDEADLVVSSAGNFLYSSGRFSFAFLMNIFVLAYAVLLKKPLYMLPQTLGPLRHRWEGWLLGLIARRMRRVFVRDPISMRLLQKVNGWHDRCQLVPDVAFIFPGGTPSEGHALLDIANAQPVSPRLGVTLINWQAQNPQFKRQEAYETAVATAIRTFIKQTGGQAILFSQVRGPSPAEDDRVPARRVANTLADLGSRVVLIEEANVTAEALKAAYGLMDIFIGTRLHSNIFALTAGTPAVMLQYQYKTRGVVEIMGLEDWVIDINEVNESNLSEKLVGLWIEREVVKRRIHQAVQETIQQIEQVGVLIAADYEAIF